MLIESGERESVCGRMVVEWAVERAYVEFAGCVEWREVIAEGGLVKVIWWERLKGCEYMSEGMDICFIWSAKSVIVMLMHSGLAVVRWWKRCLLNLRWKLEWKREEKTECSSRSLWLMAVIELVSQFGKEWAECERKCQMPLEIRALPSPLCSSPLSFCLLSVSLLSHVLILSACYANPALFYLLISLSSFPLPTCQLQSSFCLLCVAW